MRLCYTKEKLLSYYKIFNLEDDSKLKLLFE